MQYKRYTAGSAIVKEGEMSDGCVYLILSGTAEVRILNGVRNNNGPFNNAKFVKKPTFKRMPAIEVIRAEDAEVKRKKSLLKSSSSVASLSGSMKLSRSKSRKNLSPQKQKFKVTVNSSSNGNSPFHSMNNTPTNFMSAMNTPS